MNLLSLVLANWKYLAVGAFILTSAVRIELVNDNRSEVRALAASITISEQLLMENRQLNLELSVLERTTRLQEYATTELKMQSPSETRSLANSN